MHPLSRQLEASAADILNSENKREELKEFDQLLIERRKGNAFIGLKDGEFWKFKCSYKYQLGEVDKYRYMISQVVSQIYPNIFFKKFEADAIVDRQSSLLYVR